MSMWCVFEWACEWVCVLLRLCSCMFVCVCVSEIQIDWYKNRLVFSVRHSYPSSIQAREDFVSLSHPSRFLQAPPLPSLPLPDTSTIPSSHPSLLTKIFSILLFSLRPSSCTYRHFLSSCPFPVRAHLVTLSSHQSHPVSAPCSLSVPSSFPVQYGGRTSSLIFKWLMTFIVLQLE